MNAPSQSRGGTNDRQFYTAVSADRRGTVTGVTAGMSLERITDHSVKDGLRALRQTRSLRASPLLHLDLVTLRLRSEGLADTSRTRQWMLGRLLDETVRDALQRMRGSGESESPAAPTRDQALGEIKEDFASGEAERQAWAILRFRYLLSIRAPVKTAIEVTGVPQRTLYRRMRLGVMLLAAALRAREQAAAKALQEVAGPALPERVFVEERVESERPGLAASEPAAAGDALRALLKRDVGSLRVGREELAEIARTPPKDIEGYRLGRLAAWLRPRFRLDERFVQMSVLTDVGEDAPGERWQTREERFSDLRDALSAQTEPACVLLGPPGAGKSTLLRRLELDLAAEGLGPPGKRAGVPLTFYVPLNLFPAPAPGTPPPEPRAWLAELWQDRYPRLPDLRKILATQGMVFLLDGLNEMPHRSANEYHDLVGMWRSFLHASLDPANGHRALIACRSLRYSSPLSTADLRVPQFVLEPLDDAKVQAFLARYCPEHAERLWRVLEGSPLLETLRWPFFLELYLETAGEEGGGSPVGLADLFTAQARRALQRELLADNPRFRPNGLIDARERSRALRAKAWPDPHALPSRGPLFTGLSRLAYRMQEAELGGAASQIRIAFDAAAALLETEGGEVLLEAGSDLGILEEDLSAGDIQYRHQLLQEYFAARRLAARPVAGHVARAWRRDGVRPPLEEVVEALGPGEALPPLAETGWEVTIELAAAMAREPRTFVRMVADENLSLAGRIAAKPELRERLSPQDRNTLRWALVERSRNPEADLRDRLACAWALGDLGDPRLTPVEGPEGPYVMPRLIDIPGDRYELGSDRPIEGGMLHTGEVILRKAHMPRHALRLEAFGIGAHPITNAEWTCFVESGGYEDERWWDTEDGRRWRRGEIPNIEGMRNNRLWRGFFLEDPDLLQRLEERKTIPPVEIERWRSWLPLDDAAFEAALQVRWRGKVLTEPQHWHEERFSHPLQPVVGICWYEARAYCRWLEAQSGLPFRLPTEVEWEAASYGGPRGGGHARGPDHLWRGNFYPTKIHRPSPIGVFPAGDSPLGVTDLVGNTNEWTSSLYGASDEAPDFAYPYRADDGREDPLAGVELRRVSRGGAWNDGVGDAANYVLHRDHACPVDRRTSRGMRVAVTR